MAERRMFSKRIINSARFLKMPISTQCLYFHLGLHADDDGLVEAYTVINSTGATEDDLRVLVAKGFVFVLNEDLVTYITDWQENNKIRADRKVDSIYKDLLIQMLPDVSIQQKRERADVKKKLDNQWTSNGQPMDGIGEVRIGEDRLGKESIDYISIKDTFNSMCPSLPTVRTLSDARKRAIKGVLKKYSLEQVLEAFAKAEASDFLTGKNGDWNANFDWIMKDSNMAKILDGNYDNKKGGNGNGESEKPAAEPKYRMGLYI
jgi:hypothetical protein